MSLDDDPPSCWTRVIRKARKPHKCCECKKEIPAGVKYEYCSGVWVGEPASFKTCARCALVRGPFFISGDCPGLGYLWAEIRELGGENHPEVAPGIYAAEKLLTERGLE